MVNFAAVRTANAAPIVRRWPPLYLQVILAVVAGAAVGLFFPRFGAEMKPLSDGFITLIRAVVPPIIFATVSVGIARMRDVREVGDVGWRALVYFEIVSTVALLIGLVVANLFEPGGGMHIDPASLDDKAVAGYAAGAKSVTLVDFFIKML